MNNFTGQYAYTTDILSNDKYSQYVSNDVLLFDNKLISTVKDIISLMSLKLNNIDNVIDSKFEVVSSKIDYFSQKMERLENKIASIILDYVDDKLISYKSSIYKMGSRLDHIEFLMNIKSDNKIVSELLNNSLNNIEKIGIDTRLSDVSVKKDVDVKVDVRNNVKDLKDLHKLLQDLPSHQIIPKSTPVKTDDNCKEPKNMALSDIAIESIMSVFENKAEI